MSFIFLYSNRSRPSIRKAAALFSIAAITVLALLQIFKLDALSQDAAPYLEHVRAIETANFGLENPEALAYDGRSGWFFVFQGRRAAAFDNDKILNSAFATGLDAGEISQVAFLGAGQQPLALDRDAKTLFQLGIGTARPLARIDIRPYGLEDVRGFAADPASAALFFLEGSSMTLVRVDPASSGSYEGSVVIAQNRLERTSLSDLMGRNLRGLAYDPAAGEFYTADVENQVLITFSDTGRLIASRDLSQLALVEPLSLVTAPSGDSTDHPSHQSVYLLDSGRGLVHELSFDTPVRPHPELPLVGVTLVQSFTTNITNTNWTHNAPDPIGIDYHPDLGYLIISDSEIEEAPQPYYEGYNVFYSSLSGTEVGNCDTTIANGGFSNEPVAVAINPDNGHIYYSQDNFPYGIYQVDFGSDGQYCTGDDVVTFYNTRCVGSEDPEGIAIVNGMYYVSDGVDQEVYIIEPGPNGVYDSVDNALYATCNGDDTFTSFDTFALGLNDPEGIDYGDDTGELFIVNRNNDILIRTSLTGTLITNWDLTVLNAVFPGSVSMAPGSITPTKTMAYIAQRGIDNGANELENDGVVYEVDLGIQVSPPITITDLSISISGTDSVLTWTAVTSNTNNVPLTVKNYHIYRDTDPDVDLTTPYTSVLQTIFTDTNAVSDTVQYYYAVIVEDTVGRTSAASNRVGLFPFTLFPGALLNSPQGAAPEAAAGSEPVAAGSQAGGIRVQRKTNT